MLKPSAPAMPGVTDTLEFVKNLWGSMQIPGTGMPGMPGMAGIAAPPMSTEDLDKRIADLKAVESWLNLNLSMLRGTIQALEVQRGTLMTLKTMGASMAEAMRQSGVSAEKMASMPFSPFFGAQGQGGAAAKPAPGAPAAKTDTPKAPDAAAASSGGSAQPGTTAPQSAATADVQGNPAAMAMPAAVAWWNMLQEQFTQAVTNAMTPSAAPSAAPGQEGGGAPKAELPRAASKTAMAPPGEGSGGTAAGNGNGNSKTARTSRTKTDKP
jgi:hypothetical protein